MYVQPNNGIQSKLLCTNIKRKTDHKHVTNINIEAFFPKEVGVG
jgi:hypothetical protein